MADSLYVEDNGKVKARRDDSLIYKPSEVKSLSADTTLVAGDDGNVYTVDAVDLVVTLPSTIAGFTVTFVVLTASATTGLSLSPAAVDKIQGSGITAADNKDLINSAGSDAVGDSVTLVGDGSAGWLITNMIGTWAREA